MTNPNVAPTSEINNENPYELPVALSPQGAAMLRIGALLDGRYEVTVDKVQPPKEEGSVNLIIHHNVPGDDVTTLSESVTKPLLDAGKAVWSKLVGIIDASAK